MSDSNQNQFVNRQRDTKISDFVGTESLQATDLVTVVQNGTNKNMTVSAFLASLGFEGQLIQGGDETGTPILQDQGSVNVIRNIEDGPGIKTTVSDLNGVTVEHNFSQDDTGFPILRNIADIQPTFISLVEGDGIDLQLSGKSLTISASGSAAAQDVVDVNSLSSFPSPINDVITLEPLIGYRMVNAVSSPYPFVFSEGSALVGVSPNIAKLEYTGTGTMFIGVDVGIDIRTLRFSCPNGTAFDVTETGTGGTKLFSMDSCVLESCQSIGTFGNLYAVNISNCGVFCTQGALFTGSNWSLISCNRFSLTSLDAGFVGINLGTSISSSIELGELLIQGVSGAFGISGLPNGGNISPGNSGVIAGCNFIGDISAEGGGLDAANSIRWKTRGNSRIADKSPEALITLSGNIVQTVITAINTPVKVAGNWVVNSSSIFSADATGTIAYDGEEDFRCPINFSSSCVSASGGSVNVTLYLAINGSVVPDTASPITLSASSPSSTSLTWKNTFKTGSTVELWAENNSNTTNLIFQAVGNVN